MLSAAKKSALESLPIEPEMFSAKKTVPNFQWLLNRNPPVRYPQPKALLKLPLVSLNKAGYQTFVSEVSALGREVFFSHETNTRNSSQEKAYFPLPTGSMELVYLYTYIQLISMANVGKYTIRGPYGLYCLFHRDP